MIIQEKIKKREQLIKQRKEKIKKEEDQIKKLENEIKSLKAVQIQSLINEIDMPYDDVVKFIKDLKG